jgi:D-serine deaminase-like pyridoxal phosphate-dependent protein
MRNWDEIATPVLVVDLDALERNLARMADYFSGRASKLRPHFKSHKCVELARRQLAAGNCAGMTCAKLSEAEVLVAGGITDVLIANQVVGAAKATRLADLNCKALVRCAVDSAANVDELAAAARKAGVVIPVLVEVDVGMQRCGVAPGAPAVELARRVAASDGLRFEGLQGYEGHVIMTEDYDERRALTEAALTPLVATRHELESTGIPVAIVSSGGTGTYDIAGNIDGIDEVQCGTYALMDASYKRIRPEFEIARTVMATVISATPSYAVVDVGAKGLGGEFGLPEVVGHPEATARYTAEEHVPFDGMTAEVGARLQVVPSHGCTTQNLYRRMLIVRDGDMIDEWAIEGSGCLE